MSSNSSFLLLNSTLYVPIGGLAYIRQHAPISILYMIFVGLVAVLGTIGNALLICVIYRSKEFRNAGYPLLVNMAIVDMLVAAIANGQSFIGFLFGEAVFQSKPFCQALGFVSRTFGVTLVITIPIIAFNRYIKICRPQLYEKIFSQRKIIFVCINMWILSAFMQGLLFIGWSHFALDRKVIACMIDGSGTRSWAIFTIGFFIIVPGCLSAIFYFKIYLFVRASKHRVNASANSNTSQVVDTNVTVTLFCVSIAYFLFWLPLPAVYIMDSPDTLSMWSYSFALTIGYADSAINPVVYGLTNKAFRKSLLQLLGCARCCKQSMIFYATSQGVKLTIQPNVPSIVASRSRPTHPEFTAHSYAE